MPGIPLKSGADFCVLEAARMRLHNLGSDPNEYGAGLIYYNTSEGKNTSKRIRIYDGANFRSLAFLDEIANNEAFNALVARVGVAEGGIDSLEGRTDALEALFNGSNAKVADNALMLGGQLPSYYAQSSVLAQLRSEFDALYKTLNDDTTGVIDTWQEVVDFVNEYSGSEDLSTILAGMNTQIADRYTKAEADELYAKYLPLTGGMIEGTGANLFSINRKDGNPYINFHNNGNLLGRIGFNTNGELIASVNNAIKNILHSGNFADQIGDTYLKTDGSNVMGKDAYIAWNTTSEDNDVADWDAVTGRGLRIISSTSATSNAPDQYSTALHVKGRYGFQLAVKGGASPSFHIRSAQSGVNTWREILHSGNYSDLITTLNKTLSVPRVLVGTQGLRVTGNLNVPIEINGSNIKRYGRSGGYLLSDEYYGLTPTKLLVQVGVFATDDTLEHYCIGNRIESSAAGERWFAINSASSAFYVPTSFSSGITTNELTIDGIRLSVVDGKLKIEGDAFATGELSAGGAGEEGDEGMGLALLEDWTYYDATKAQALGAVLGKDMYDRIVTLEGRATKVGVIRTLTSGKKIGVIEVDGNSTSLFAPATYAWSEITSKPTTLAGYGITDAIKADGSTPLVGSLTIASASDKKIVLNNTDADDKYQFISFCQNGVEYGSLGTTGDNNLKWNNKLVLHEGNVSDYAMLFLGSSLTDIDANTYSNKAGVYGISNGANTPARYGSILNLTYRVLTGSSKPNYMGQIFIPNGNDTDLSLYFRTSLATEWNPWRKVIDDVIIGDYAALKDGSNASGTWGINISGNAAKLKSFEKEDANTVNYNGIFTVTSSKSQNVPSTYGVGFQFTSKDNPVAGTNMHWFAQLYSSSLNNLYYRGRINEDDWSDWKTIAFTDQVLLLNGSNKIGAGKYINWEGSNLDAEDYESFGYGIRILTYDTASRNNRGGLSVGTRYGFQLTRLANNDESSLTVRFNDPNNDNAWGDWKTLAFTDSDITGNAATATKLKAAVSLWGNEFDGTQSLTKGIWVGVGNDYNFLSGSSSISAMTVNSSLTNFLIGYGTTQDSRTINTFLDGYNIYFRTGAKQTVMTITNAGKVRIDSSGILDRLLSIGSGGVYVNAALNESPALGSVGSNSLLVGASAYGMQHWVLGNGVGNIQVGRFDGTATAYALNLNPLGGAVNIASADAYTNVLGGLITSSSQNGLGFVGRRIYLASNGKIESSSSMVFDDEYIAVEKRLSPNASNTYSLGTPAYRWSNVYSVNGDFSGRVLINGVSDDGSSALSVTGALKVCRNTSSTDTFLQVTSNDTIVKYMGYDSLDGFCSHDFYSHDKLLLHISATKAESQFYTKLAASGLITASGGLYIPTGQSFKIGEATLSWDSANNALKVDKSIYSDGEVSAGGAGNEEEGTTTGGGREPWASEPFAVTSTSMTFNHNIGTEDVIVQVYERDATSGHWSLILVDVEIVDNASIALHFGRTETTLHKVIVMG